MIETAVGIEQVDGVPVRISRKAGKPLMLLTRMASQGTGIWDAVWDRLAEDFTVANFDLIASARLAADMPARDRFSRMADASVAVARGLGFPKFHVFGWHGGCHVALACLTAHPGQIASAVLLDPFFELGDMRKVEAAIAFMKVLFTQPDRSLYARYWVMSGFSSGFLEREFDVVEKMTAARVDQDRFGTIDSEKWLRWVWALRTNWLTDAELQAVTAPVLVLATELDNWHAGPTVGMAEQVARRLRSSEFSVIEGLGPFFFIEAPERFEEVAGSFLGRVSALGRPERDHGQGAFG